MIKAFDSRSLKQTGFGLIEVIVALVICSFALGGALFSSFKSLRAAQDSMHETQAALIMSDLAGMVVINHGVFRNRADFSFETAAGKSNNGAVAGTHTAMRRSFRVWENALEALLPGAEGAFEYQDSTRLYTVTVRWSSRSAPSASGSKFERSLTGTL